MKIKIEMINRIVQALPLEQVYQFLVKVVSESESEP